METVYIISSVIIFIAVLSVAGSLKCYRCIALDCPGEEEFCNEVRTFALNHFTDYYYMDNNLPDCPKPLGELDQWKNMENTYPSSVPCGALQENEATCSLGRFQVKTNIVSSNQNITSHGTVLGCARIKLLEATVVKFKYIDPKSKGSPNASKERHVVINKCSVVSFNNNGGFLRHYMELENCAKITDMCHLSSFCIPPENSIVKEFQNQDYKPNIPVFLIFTIVGIIGLVVCVFAFLGVLF